MSNLFFYAEITVDKNHHFDQIYRLSQQIKPQYIILSVLQTRWIVRVRFHPLHKPN